MRLNYTTTPTNKNRAKLNFNSQEIMAPIVIDDRHDGIITQYLDDDGQAVYRPEKATTVIGYYSDGPYAGDTFVINITDWRSLPRPH